MSQDLIARLAAAEAEVAAVRAELAKAQEPKPWARWKPEHDGTYWFVNSWGRTEETHWLDWDTDRARYNLGNVHPTPEAAERHAKRIRSMVPTCPVPKMGDECWFVSLNESGVSVLSRYWDGSEVHRVLYNHGRLFTTREAAQAWADEFSDAWSELEGGS